MAAAADLLRNTGNETAGSRSAVAVWPQRTSSIVSYRVHDPNCRFLTYIECLRPFSPTRGSAGGEARQGKARRCRSTDVLLSCLHSYLSACLLAVSQIEKRPYAVTMPACLPACMPTGIQNNLGRHPFVCLPMMFFPVWFA